MNTETSATANTIKAGIIGGAGYTGGETIRLLIHHPYIELAFVNSKSNAGKAIYSVHSDLLGDTDLFFTDTIDTSVDVLFLCLGHGDSALWLQQHPLPNTVKIIDLSQDFRLSAQGNDFVYGLPELNKSEIQKANKIANPGCFATCIQLGLLPLAASQLLNSSVFINATTGSTGAGQKPSSSSHFSWRSSNLSVYKAFDHQHLGEIGQSLNSLQKGFSKSQIHFIPERGAFSRGILANMVIETEKSLEELQAIYNNFYEDASFTFVSDQDIDLKMVVNTNKCFIQLQKNENRLLVTSIIDNLLKGAAGQAVQNMNLIFGFPERAGLNLKPSAF